MAGATAADSVAPKRHPLNASLFRVRSTGGEVVGAAFLAGAGLLCTCAHVVAQALDVADDIALAPTGAVRLEFYENGHVVEATVRVWRPVGGDAPEDIALLEPVPGAVLPERAWPARMVMSESLTGHAFSVCGFAGGVAAGTWASGVLEERRPNGTLQMERGGAEGIVIQPGFSGAPVWDRRERGVAGMVVSSWRDRGAGVAFLIPVDQLVAGTGLLHPTHQPPGGYGALTGGVTSAARPLGLFLRHYLGTPDAPVPYGGRDDQHTALDHWLDDTASPSLLLTAPAGRGKTSLLAHWAIDVAQAGRANVVFAPVSAVFGTNLHRVVQSLIVERLRYLLPEAAEIADADVPAVLSEDRPGDQPPLLVIVDAIDDAADWNPERDLPLPLFAGAGVKMLISARVLARRDAEGWLSALGWTPDTTRQLELPPFDRQGVADLLRARVDAGAAGSLDEMVTSVMAVTDGDPLLVGMSVDALGDHGFDAADASNGPVAKGLEGYFRRWWDAQLESWQAQGRDPEVETGHADQIFGVLASVLGPIGRDELITLADLPSGARLEARLNDLGRWIIPGDAGEDDTRRTYAFGHGRFGEYWREHVMSATQRASVRARVLEFCRGESERLLGGADPATISPYAIRYYGAHLEGAQAAEQLDRLVAPEWWRAHQMLDGSQEAFVREVRRAWDLADEALTRAGATPLPAGSLAPVLRYAIVESSLNTFSGNVPAELLAQLVDHGVWPLPAALEEVRRNPNARSRCRAFATLADVVGGHERYELLAAALAAARQLEPDWNFTETMDALAPMLPPELLEQATELAQGLPDPVWKARALITLGTAAEGARRDAVHASALTAAAAAEGFFEPAASLAEVFGAATGAIRTAALRAALQAARSAPLGADERARELIMIAAAADEAERDALIEEALAATLAVVVEDDDPSEDGVQWTPGNVVALGELVPLLSGEALERAVAAAQRLGPGNDAATILKGALPRLARADTARAIALSELCERERPVALCAMAACLEDVADVEAVVSAARAVGHDYHRDRVLAACATRMGELGDVEAGLALARSLRSPVPRLEALARLALPLDDPERSGVAAEALAEAQERDAAAWLATHLDFADIAESPLVDLAVRLGEVGDVELARSLVRSVPTFRPDGSAGSGVLARARVAAVLAREDARELVTEALDATRVIADGVLRAVATSALAQAASPAMAAAFSEQIGVALEWLRAITDDEQSVRVLETLLPHLDRAQLGSALELARALHRPHDRVTVLAGIAGRLDGEARGEVVEEAIEHSAGVRGRWAYQSAERLMPVVGVERQRGQMQHVRDGSGPRWLIDVLAQTVAPELVPELFDLVLGSADVDVRTGGLAGLASRLPDAAIAQALAAISALPMPGRLTGLAALAPRLEDEALDAALRLAATREHEAADGPDAYRACAALALRLADADRFDDALGLLARIPAEEQSVPGVGGSLWAETVASTTRHLPDDQRAEMLLGTIQQFEFEPRWYEVIATLLSAVPRPASHECAARLLDAIAELQDDDRKAARLKLLAPSLSPPAAIEAFRLASGLRASAYLNVCPRAEALQALVPRLMESDASIWIPEWQRALRLSATRERGELLWDMPAFIPMLTALGGTESLIDAASAVATVVRWWP